MFGSCLNRNDIFPKPKMFEGIPDWLERLKSITDYQITKWDSYEDTKQDKISATYPILFNNNNLSFSDTYVMDIVRPSLAAVSESCSNAISGFLSGLESMFVTRNDVNNVIDDILDTRLEGYDETIYLKQQWNRDIDLFTYSKVDIQNFLADKQGTLTFGKGIRVEPGDELSVNIERELAIKRYFDIDKHVYDDRANKDEEEEESIETVMNLDEFEDIIGYQAFTVKNLLRVLYDEDTKTYKLTVPYTNRLVDADYAISSRTILRELRSEYEKKIFVLGDSIQLANIDWFIKKFRDAYEGDPRIGKQDYSDPSKVTNEDIRTAFFRTNPDYPLLKTDFEGWYEVEFGPTAVNRLTDLVTDMYQRAIILSPSFNSLDKNADGTSAEGYYWKETSDNHPSGKTYCDYYCIEGDDGELHYPDQYSIPSVYDVKKKITDIFNWIGDITIDVNHVDNTNTFNINLKDGFGNLNKPDTQSTTGSKINFNLNFDSTNRKVQLKSGDTNLTEIQLTDWVTKDTEQTITGKKIFNNDIYVYNNKGLKYTVTNGGVTTERYMIAKDNTSKIIVGNSGDLLQLQGTGARPTYTAYTNPNATSEIALMSDIEALPEPMIFKGSVGDDNSSTILWTNLPTPSASNKGFTYKAISDRTTSQTSTLSHNVKEGDTIISDATNWIVIPSGDEPSGTVTSISTESASNSHLTLTTTNNQAITGSGTITVGVESGYAIPTTSKQTDWDNKIAGVQLNGTDLTIDVNKKVNVIVPQVYRYV